MILCYKAIRMDGKISGEHRNVNERQNKQKEILAELVLNEIVEVLVPIAFIASFSLAYYGPNKNILGNVGCSIWHYKKIDDLHAFLMPVAEMALLDSASVMLAGMSLWWFCHISIWKEYCRIIKQYWTYLALRGGTFIAVVSI